MEEEIAFIKENLNCLTKEYLLYLLIREGDSQEYVEELLGQKLEIGTTSQVAIERNLREGYAIEQHYIQMPAIGLHESPYAIGQAGIRFDQSHNVVAKKFNGPQTNTGVHIQFGWTPKEKK